MEFVRTSQAPFLYSNRTAFDKMIGKVNQLWNFIMKLFNDGCNIKRRGIHVCL